MPDDIKKFFENAIEDSREHGSKIVLSTLVLDDGIGDAGMLSFLYEKIRRIEGLAVRVVVFSSKNDITELKKKMSDLFGDDVEIEFAENNSKEDYYNSRNFFQKDEYVIFYPYTLAAQPQNIEAKGVLAIKEMNCKKDGCFKTGCSDGGIGFGIPQWEEKKEGSCQLTPKWLISCKSYLAGCSKEIGPEKPETVCRRIKRVLALGDKVGIESMLFILPEDMLYLVDELKSNYPNIDDKVNFVASLPKNCLRLCLDNTREVVFSGGEGLFVEAMGTHGGATSILCPRYDFQCAEIFWNLLIKEPVKETKNYEKYRFFYAKNEKGFKGFLYFDGNDFLDILHEFKKCPKDSLIFYTNKALQAMWLPLYINTDKIEIKLPPVYNTEKEAYEHSLQTFRELNDKWKTRNWFSVFDELK